MPGVEMHAGVLWELLQTWKPLLCVLSWWHTFRQGSCMRVGPNEASRQWSGVSNLVPFEGNLINTWTTWRTKPAHDKQRNKISSNAIANTDIARKAGKNFGCHCPFFSAEFYEQMLSLEIATLTFLKGKLCSFQNSSQKYTTAMNEMCRRVPCFSCRLAEAWM